LPVIAPGGTGVVMLVLLQELGVATVPLNVTVLVPWVAPKLEPVMVTNVPIAAAGGLTLDMPGAEVIVKVADTTALSVIPVS